MVECGEGRTRGRRFFFYLELVFIGSVLIKVIDGLENIKRRFFFSINLNDLNCGGIYIFCFIYFMF